MTFTDIAAELSQATGRTITYQAISQDEFVEGIKQSGAPREMVWLLDYLFSTVLDGRNAHICDGVQRALARPPRDFSEYAKKTAATGIWNASTPQAQQLA